MKGKIVIVRNMFYGASQGIFRKAYELRRNETEAEKKLWSYLNRKGHFHYRFRRQHPVDIFIVDFYCHKLKLAIEVDGDVHKSKKQQEYDLGRSHDLNKYGIKIIRFKNEEVLNNIENVIQTIHNEISDLSPL